MKIKIFFSVCMFVVFFSNVIMAQRYTIVKQEMSELKIIDTNFIFILDTIIQEVKQCNDFNESYSWSIYIKDTIDHTGNIYISRSDIKDGCYGGYGYFYHQNILFVVNGKMFFELFENTNIKTKMSIYMINPSFPPYIFDPPRWSYYYDDGKFDLDYSVPCGG